MPRIEIFRFQVHFGDCDPAGIAFYPNFFAGTTRPRGTSSTAVACHPGVRRKKTHGIIGVPLVEAQSRFIKPTTYGDHVEVHTHISSWEAKVFCQTHELKRDGELLAVGEERRVFACRDPQTGRIRSIPVPPEFRALCG